MSEQDEASELIEQSLTNRFLREPIPTAKREEMWRKPEGSIDGERDAETRAEKAAT